MRCVICCCFVFAFIVGCKDDRPTEQPYHLEHLYGVSDPAFERTMTSLMGPPLIPGNTATTLVNGDQIFPAMLKAIREAEKSIDFETYVYWRGSISDQFTDALAERAANGVQVRVIFDPLGSDKVDRKAVKKLKARGVQVVEYHNLKWYDWTSAQKLNNRTHRK